MECVGSRRTSSRPSRLAVPDLNLVATANLLLNVADGLEHVAQVHVGGIVAARTLPERERVDHENVNGWEDSVRSAIVELVPRVRSANLNVIRQLALDGIDLGLELRAREIAAVQRLGADSHGVDGVLVLVCDGGDGVEVVVEGFFDVGPAMLVRTLTQGGHKGSKAAYQIPSTTLKPFFSAAGRIALVMLQSAAAYPRTIVAPDAVLMASKSAS